MGLVGVVGGGHHVLELLEHRGDPVEGLRNGVGAPADLRTQLVGVLEQLRVALPPPGMVFAFGAAVARVCLQSSAQLGDLLLLLLAPGEVEPRGPAPRGPRVGDGVVQGRCEVATFLGAAAGKSLGDADARDDLDRPVKVLHADAPDLFFLGEDRGARVIPCRVQLDDNATPQSARAVDLDDVAEHQGLERFAGRRAALAGDSLRRLLFRLGQRVAQCRVFAEVPQMAGHGLFVAFEGFLPRTDLASEADHRAVRLELREGRLQDSAGTIAPELGGQVQRHVVGRAEA